MASGGAKIGSGTVDIHADLSSYDAAMNALPARSEKKIAEVMQRLKAEMARTKLDIKVATQHAGSQGVIDDPKKAVEAVNAINKLMGVQGQLAAKIAAVEAVAIREATALQDTARQANVAAQAKKQLADASRAEAAEASAAAQVIKQTHADFDKATKESAAVAQRSAKETAAIEKAEALEAARVIKETHAEFDRNAKESAKVAADAAKQAAQKSPLPSFSEAMTQLPGSRDKITEQIDAIKKKLSENKIKLDDAIISPDIGKNSAVIDKLVAKEAQLKTQLEQVQRSAILQATAFKINAAAAAGDTAEVDRLTVAQQQLLQTTARANAGFGSAGRASGKFGMGILFVSQAIEDLQYGFSAIVNNIPSIAMAFGASAGVAGGISIASVAINLLIKHWDSLMAAFGNSPIKTQSQLMEELGKKTEKTAEETLKLLNYERSRKNLEERKAPSKHQSENEETVTEAFKESPYQSARRGLDIFLKGLPGGGPANMAANPDYREKFRENEEAQRVKKLAESQLTSKNPEIYNSAQENIERIRDRAIKAEKALAGLFDQSVEQFIGTLGNDADELRKFLNQAYKDPKNFGPNGRQFLDKLASTLPENQFSPQEIAEQKRSKEDRDRRRAANEKRQAEGDERLSVQAQNAEDHYQGVKQKADRLADPFRNRIQQSMLQDPDSEKARESRQANITKNLREAGKSAEEIEELVPKIIDKIREDLKKAVEEKMIGEGISSQAAKAKVAADLREENESSVKKSVEANEIARKKASGLIRAGMSEQETSQRFSSGNDLASSIIQRALDGKGDVQQKIAEGIEKSKVTLDEIAKNTAAIPKMGAIQRARFE